MELTRRQVLRGGLVALAAAGVGATSGCSDSGSPARVAALPAAVWVGQWLADVAAASGGETIARDLEGTALVPDWRAHQGRLDRAIKASGQFYYHGWFYGLPEERHRQEVVLPASVAVAMTGKIRTGPARFDDPALFVTPGGAALVPWWARQALTAVLADVDRVEDRDDADRVPQELLFRHTALPAGDAASEASPDGRSQRLNYPAADGSRVTFDYVRAESGAERVTATVPGFPRAGGPPVWEVPLVRELVAV